MSDGDMENNSELVPAFIIIAIYALALWANYYSTREPTPASSRLPPSPPDHKVTVAGLVEDLTNTSDALQRLVQDGLEVLKTVDLQQERIVAEVNGVTDRMIAQVKRHLQELEQRLRENTGDPRSQQVASEVSRLRAEVLVRIEERIRALTPIMLLNLTPAHVVKSTDDVKDYLVQLLASLFGDLLDTLQTRHQDQK